MFMMWWEIQYLIFLIYILICKTYIYISYLPFVLFYYFIFLYNFEFSIILKKTRRVWNITDTPHNTRKSIYKNKYIKALILETI